MPTKFDKF